MLLKSIPIGSSFHEICFFCYFHYLYYVSKVKISKIWDVCPLTILTKKSRECCRVMVYDDDNHYCVNNQKDEEAQKQRWACWCVLG